MHTPSGPSGGSAVGLLFGVLGTSMMLFAGLLAARKSVRVRRLGSAQFWLKGHLWLGTLCIPFILFHAGFGWGGFLEQLLWYTLALVAGSGFFGLAVQQFLPRLLWNQTPLETFEAQTPYQCDRMTFISDQQVSALCGAPLDIPADHLRGHISKLVRDYYDIVNGPGARGELNARKLQLLQQVSPPAVRDFFWAMAKYAKSEAKAIRFEGDFPELLAATYAGLKPETTESIKPIAHESHSSGKTAAPKGDKPQPVAGVAAQSPGPQAALDDAGTATTSGNAGASVIPAGAPKLSPLEMMKKKAEEKKAGSPASVPDSSGATTSVQKPTPEASSETSKLSPLELMKKKAAEKKEAAQNGGAQPIPISADEKPAADVTNAQPAVAAEEPTAKLSPLELMKKKAAEKKAAAQNGGAQPIPISADEKPAADVTNEQPAVAAEEPAAKLSPLELMKKKAAEKKAAAQNGGAQPIPISADEKPAADVTNEQPAVAAEEPAAKLSPLELMKKQAAEKKAAAQSGGAQPVPVSADEKPAADVTSEQSAVAAEEPAAKLSPLELMKKKAAEKKAAAESSGAQPVPVSADEKPAAEVTNEKSDVAAEQPSAKLSPLELMKKKAAEKASQGDTSKSAEVSPAVPVKAVKSPLDMLKKNTDAPAAAPAAKPPISPKTAVAKEQGQNPTVAVPKVASPITAPTDSEKQVLRAVYMETIRPFLAEFRTRRSVISSPLASSEAARRLFHEKESSLPSGLHPLLNELNGYCEIRRQIEQQRRVLRWMHWWLMVHVPASMVLIVFLVAHVIMALRVIPF
jgi:hypothetical protein